jgi:DNA (cytosine-5)-methyltransferase 1
LPTDARDTSISDSLTVSQQAAVALPVAFKVRGGVEVDSAGKAAGKGYLGSEETAFTLAATQNQWVGTPPAMRVRRLTPVEWERLQGFPDNFTNIPWRKKPEAPDGPRYKALGNSMAVPCMQWIGERIAMVDAL